MNRLIRAALIGTALAATVVTTAGAATVPKATKTVLTVSEVSLGNVGGVSSLAQQWTAKVTAAGARVAVEGSQVSFVLSEGRAVLATFGTRGGRPDCSFKVSITATNETIKATAPDLCSGGTAGYVQLTYAEITSPRIALRAVYAGGVGWKASKSGTINPERQVTTRRAVSSKS